MSVKISLVLIIALLWSFYFVNNTNGHTETRTVQHVKTEHPEKNGFWEKKVSWKPRWVKYWRQKAYYVPFWKKVWGPIVHNEWVPLPKPPPSWR